VLTLRANIRLLSSGLVALVLSLLLTATASGHAELIGAEPADGAVISSGQQRVQLLFSERVEPRFSAVRVYDTNGGRVDSGHARVASADPRLLETELRALDGGLYTVAWRVYSLDGHVGRGTFVFSVGDRASPRLSAAFEPAPEGVPVGVDAAARWALYLALFGLVGGLAFRLLVAPAGGSLILIAGALALLTHAVGLVLQAATLAELPVADVLRGQGLEQVLTSTRFGTLWLLRGALLVVALAASIAAVSDRSPRLLWWIGAGAGVGALLTLSAGGHASGAPEPRWIAVGIDWIHLVAASIWLGGLVQLMVGLRGWEATTRRGVVRRFSVVAGICVGLLLPTGLYSAIVHVPTWQALVDTAYGAALTTKLLLVGPLLLLAGCSLLLILRGHGSVFDREVGTNLGTVGRLEVGVGVVILATTSLLVMLPPATNLVQPQPFRAVRPTGDLSVELLVTPNQAGRNRIEVAVRGPALEPISAETVELRLTMSNMEMETRRLIAQSTGSGRYQVSGTELSMAGPWTATVLVGDSTDSVSTPPPASFDFTVGQTIEANRPAFSPLQVALLVLLPRGGDGSAQINWGLLSATFAVGIGAILLVRAGSRPRGLASGPSGLPRTSQLVTGVCLLGLGFLLGGVSLADAYRRTLPPVALAASSIPAPRDDAAVARGQEVYVNAGCVACHGVGGRGDGPEGIGLVPPPADLRVHMADNHSAAQIFDWIARGIPGTSMPAFESRLSPQQIEDVSAYIRTLADAR
jgi:copper transport protein